MGQPPTRRRGATDVVACDGAEFRAADLATIERLARLGLLVRRRGARLRVDNAPAALVEIVDLCGLGDVIRCEERGPDP